jgi:hypothetical protein
MPLWVGWRRHRRAARRPGVRPHRTRYGAILRAGLLVAPARARAFHHGRGSRRRLAGSAGIEACLLEGLIFSTWFLALLVSILPNEKIKV